MWDHAWSENIPHVTVSAMSDVSVTTVKQESMAKKKNKRALRGLQHPDNKELHDFLLIQVQVLHIMIVGSR
jgi:hypothetical protein